MTTPMTRDDIVELIRQEVWKGRIYSDTGESCTEDILRALEEAGLQIVQGWLPIEGDKPEEGQSCLVWAASRIEPVIAYRAYSDGELMWFTDQNGPPMNWTPTHWKPLDRPLFAGKVQP
jgi:hypothetical protein